MAGWSIEETRQLFLEAEQGKREGSLGAAFKAVAERYNRKPNSVRNYYYSQLRAFSLVPDLAKALGINHSAEKKQFTTFTEEETDELVKHVLTQSAKGKSVRNIVQDLASGDKTLALRYQNKYRSVVVGRRSRLNRIMQELNKSRATYKNPLTGEIVAHGAPAKTPITTLLSDLPPSPALDALRTLAELLLQK